MSSTIRLQDNSRYDTMLSRTNCYRAKLLSKPSIRLFTFLQKRFANQYRPVRKQQWNQAPPAASPYASPWPGAQQPDSRFSPSRRANMPKSLHQLELHQSLPSASFGSRFWKWAALAFQVLRAAHKHPDIIWPADYPFTKTIQRVFDRVLKAYGFSPGDWKLHVVASPDIWNPDYLLSQHILVHSGILPVCKDEDGLAAALCKQIVQVQSNYYGECSDGVFLKEVWVIATPYLAWRYFIHSNENRIATKMETESDYISLKMLDKAGFDELQDEKRIDLWYKQRIQKMKKNVSEKLEKGKEGPSKEAVLLPTEIPERPKQGPSDTQGSALDVVFSGFLRMK
ncbi:uncharacterized protein PAC_16544 [Phialocephala subalpina]|uniref:Uncharacterized protein n=1 Tax=Phialocephala subalpina TaxID=576137 RepID=A0A1L7XNN6_9HELO|nr:uncharacterized protein PAC_16544 [Phialocephala subalpina]